MAAALAASLMHGCHALDCCSGGLPNGPMPQVQLSIHLVKTCHKGLCAPPLRRLSTPRGNLIWELSRPRWAFWPTSSRAAHSCAAGVPRPPPHLLPWHRLLPIHAGARGSPGPHWILPPRPQGRWGTQRPLHHCPALQMASVDPGTLLPTIFAVPSKRPSLSPLKSTLAPKAGTSLAQEPTCPEVVTLCM